MGAAVHFELESRPDPPQRQNDRQHNHDHQNHVDGRLRLCALSGDETGYLQCHADEENRQRLRGFPQQAHKAREDPFPTAASENFIHVRNEGVVVPRNSVDTATRQPSHCCTDVQQRHPAGAAEVRRDKQREGHQRHRGLGCKRA
ncbi:hypothetical protein D3C76_1238810 [compost metagenome]